MNLKRILIPSLLAFAVAISAAQKAGTTVSISGFVKKEGMSGKTFMIGGNKGTFKVDASKARIHDEAGKFFAIAKITPGSNVTAKGTLMGKDMIMATDVEVNHVKGAPKKEKKSPTKAGDPKKMPGMSKKVLKPVVQKDPVKKVEKKKVEKKKS